MAFPISTAIAELMSYAHSTPQRIQGITSTELLCKACMKPTWACMKPTWFEVKAETLSSPSSEKMAPALSKHISGKAHTFCNYRIYKHLPKLLSMAAKEPSFACESPCSGLPQGPPQLSCDPGSSLLLSCMSSTDDFTTCCEASHSKP